MKSTDKFLIGIVAGIVVLVGVAFAIVLLRPEPTYQPEDAPEGVAHNYLLALQKEDYSRAYDYLSASLASYPDSAEAFADDVDHNSWRFRSNVDTTLSVESTEIDGDRATVQVRESRFRGGDLFGGNQYTTLFEMELQLEADEWKIVDADYYFASCWEREEGCE